MMMFVRPPPLHVAKAKQLKQKKFNNSTCCMCMTDNLPSCFSCVEKELSSRSDSRRVLGFNLLNARRGVKPTPCDVRARY